MLYSVMPILFALLQSVPVWRVAPDLKIGSVDDPEQAFTGAFDVVVRDGVMYSVHENEQRVRMWDAKGKLIREIGRNGQGPGEFAGPVRAGWKGDTLWVCDSRQARISLFKPNGDFVRSILAVANSAPGAKASSNLVGRSILADGTLLGQPTLFSERTSDKRADITALVRFREGGAILDTILKFEVRQSTLEVRKDKGAMYMSQPFTDSPMPVLDGRGRAVFFINRDYAQKDRNATFQVTRIALNGDTIFTRAFYYDPKPVTDAQFDKLVEERVEMLTDSTGPRPAFMPNAGDARRAVREAMVRPRFHPPISSALGGADGTLWLQREDDGRPERLWQVMDENGRFIAVVRIPRNDRLMYASRQFIWVAQKGELDTPMLVKYRVLASGRSR